MQDCDFIPDSYHEARILRRALRLRMSCVGALIAIMALWVVVHRQQLRVVEAMRVDVRRQHEQITIHLAKKQQMETERERLRGRQRLIDHLSQNVTLEILLSDISRRMPETVVLTDLSARCSSLCRHALEEETSAVKRGVSAPGEAATGREARPAIDRVILTGIAREIPEVIEFAAALESSPLFGRVQMQMDDLKVWTGYEVRGFELVCDLATRAGDTG